MLESAGPVRSHPLKAALQLHICICMSHLTTGHVHCDVQCKFPAFDKMMRPSTSAASNRDMPKVKSPAFHVGPLAWYGACPLVAHEPPYMDGSLNRFKLEKHLRGLQSHSSALLQVLKPEIKIACTVT